MNLRRAIIVAAGCAVLVGGYWLARQSAPDEQAQGSLRQADDSIVAKQGGIGSVRPSGRAPSAPVGSISSSSAAPAWAQRSANDTPSRAAGARAADPTESGVKEDAAKQAAIQAALDRLVALQAKERPSPSEVSAAIAQLEEAQGSSVFHGLKLDVLRANLQVGQRMSELAAEFETMQKRAPGKELTADMMAKLQEMQQLQSKLRTDIAVGSSNGVGKP